MPAKQGTIGMSALYNGVDKIASIYKGSDLVYQSVSFDPNVIALLERTITSVTADMIGNITNIGQSAFHSCSLLNNIEIPEGVKYIYDTAFAYCNSLTNITLPSTITSISLGAFTTCENLKTMTILATAPPTLASYSCISTATETIYVPSSSVSAYETASEWSSLITTDGYNLKFVGI